MSAELITYGLSVIVSVMGYFLAQKDAQIKLLFEKHDVDAKELQELRVKIAERHYERGDVDGKIDKIERTVRDGFDSLGAKFDKLADALTDHLREGTR